MATLQDRMDDAAMCILYTWEPITNESAPWAMRSFFATFTRHDRARMGAFRSWWGYGSILWDLGQDPTRIRC